MVPFRFHPTIIGGLAVLFFSAHAGAKDNETNLQNGRALYTKGNSTGATPCISCHGVNGEGLAAASYPQLAQMSPGYLTKQLKDFKSASRANAIMQPIASALTDDEIKQVIGYIGTLNLPKSLNPTKQVGQGNSGEEIARVGLWDRGIPACFACHGPKGQGVSDAFPRIASQHKSYMLDQIKAWKTSTRRNDPQELMKTIASKISAEEANAVADYLSSLEVGGKK